MSIDQALLKRTAKGAYERGRSRRALGVALLALPIVLVSVLVRGVSTMTFVSGAFLSLAIFAMIQRGRFLERAVGPGLLAGIPPLVLPLVLRCAGHACAMTACAGCATMACSPICLPACVVSGVVAGVIIGAGSIAESKRPLSMLLIAALLAIVVGSLGCIFAGVFGVLGMALGTLGASAPVAAVVRMRSHPHRS